MANSKPNDPSVDSGREAEAKAARKTVIVDNTDAPEFVHVPAEETRSEIGEKGTVKVDYN